MRTFRDRCPSILIATGPAIALLFGVAAVLGYNNPLQLAALLLAGVGLGAVVSALGFGLASVFAVEAHVRQVRMDVRSFVAGQDRPSA